MTTYNQLAGYRVNYLSTDPTLSTSNEGQVWYNSTTGTLKALVQLKSWSAGGNLPVAKNEAGSDGTSTAGWTAGGSTGPAANTGTTATEEYDGSAWTAGGNLNTARTGLGGAGFGTQTAAAVSGGFIQPGAGPTRTMYANAEEYNGSTWTSVTSMPTALAGLAQCGIQTAGLSFGGSSGYASPLLTTTLEYDGTNWTSGGSLNTAAGYQAAGIQTAGLGMQTTDTTGKGTESYNGTSWTAVANRNTARAQVVGFGTQTLATIAGGYTAGPGSPQLTETEQWDGTAWGISTATLGTATRTGMGIGTQGSGTSGLLAGGYQTTYINNTQEWNSAITPLIPAGWTTGGTVATARTTGGAGTQTAGLLIGAGPGTISEEYNGSVFSSGGNLATSLAFTYGFGTQTAAVGCGGYLSSPYVRTSSTQNYDGSTWTNSGPLTEDKYSFGTAGLQTTGLAFGGRGPSLTLSTTSEYDGSSWTNVTGLPTATRGISGIGTQTAALGFGGYTPGPTGISTTYEYDGTNWTSGGSLGNATYYSGAWGSQTAGFKVGGATNGGTQIANSEKYDGTSWTAGTSFPTSFYGGTNSAGQGTQSAGLTMSGYGNGAPITTANEYNDESFGPATASTLTTS
jgi:hypothetical protein